jgi:hypothetical protein
MGNGIRRIPDGMDFSPEHFAQEKDFGFSGSTQGYDSKGSAAPPFAKSSPTNNGENFQTYAEGGPVGGSAHTYAKGGKAGHGHPHGHRVVHVHHDPSTGAVVHKHDHGGFTMHHPDGHVTHHGADGQDMAGMGSSGPGEGTHVAKMAASRGEPDADDMPPRNPQRNPSRRNAMPGGQMPYGVEPSSEPDMPPAGGAMARGGKVGGRPC